MSGDELQSMKNDITEIKGDVKNLAGEMTKLQVLVAGNYCTRADLDAAKADWLAAYKVASSRIVGIYVGIITILGGMIGYAICH